MSRFRNAGAVVTRDHLESFMKQPAKQNLRAPTTEPAFSTSSRHTSIQESSRKAQQRPPLEAETTSDSARPEKASLTAKNPRIISRATTAPIAEITAHTIPEALSSKIVDFRTEVLRRTSDDELIDRLTRMTASDQDLSERFSKTIFDVSKMLVIPMVAVLLIGGGIAFWRSENFEPQGIAAKLADDSSETLRQKPQNGNVALLADSEDDLLVSSRKRLLAKSSAALTASAKSFDDERISTYPSLNGYADVLARRSALSSARTSAAVPSPAGLTAPPRLTQEEADDLHSGFFDKLSARLSAITSNHTEAVAPRADIEDLKSKVKFISGLIAMHRPSIANCGEVAKAIVEVAVREKVDPFFIAAVISIESKFANTAVSPVGARGLMQLMPSTARSLSKMPVGSGLHAQLYDTRANIDLGVKYLQSLDAKYNGDKVLALSAYNWGPGNIDRAKVERRHIPSSVLNYATTILQRTKNWANHYQKAKESALSLDASDFAQG